VRSYFAKDLIDTRGPGILDMVTISDTTTYQVTDTVIEALILEAQVIKKFQPKYNIKEKDNKSFAYVVITDELFPRVGIIRGRTLSVGSQLDTLDAKIRYTFGPFPSVSLLTEALRIVRKIFPFRDIKSKNPHHDRFYQQLALSPDHTDTDAQREYAKTIQHIVQFFRGNKKGIIRNLEKEMEVAAKKQLFEQALRIRNKIRSLQSINDVSLMKRDFYTDVLTDGYRIESYDIAHMSGKSTVGVMTVVENRVVDKSSYRKFKIRKLAGSINDLANLAEILQRRFTHTEWKLPNLVVVDGGKTHYDHALHVLRSTGLHRSISLVAVVKDDRHRPKALLGDEKVIKKYRQEILLTNSESHRFAIEYHKLIRSKNFLK
jgi:excinuclease ABC subunit C